MKRLPFVLIVIFAVAAVACSGGTEPSPDVEPLPTAASLSEAAEPAPAAAAVPEKEAAPAVQPAAKVAETEQKGGVFRRLWADPPTLDPHLTGDTTSAGIVVEVFSGLVALNTALELVPDIAERWEIDDTGTVYTFRLRGNVKFHNGNRVTAEDFKWSLERASQPNTASAVVDTYLNDIVGFEEYFEGDSSEISGIKVIDDLTLQITIDAPKGVLLGEDDISNGVRARSRGRRVAWTQLVGGQPGGNGAVQDD